MIRRGACRALGAHTAAMGKNAQSAVLAKSQRTQSTTFHPDCQGILHHMDQTRLHQDANHAPPATSAGRAASAFCAGAIRSRTRNITTAFATLGTASSTLPRLRRVTASRTRYVFLSGIMERWLETHSRVLPAVDNQPRAKRFGTSTVRSV